MGAVCGLVGNVMLGLKFDQRSNALNATQTKHKENVKVKQGSTDMIQDLLKRMRAQYQVEMGGS